MDNQPPHHTNQRKDNPTPQLTDVSAKTKTTSKLAIILTFGVVSIGAVSVAAWLGARQATLPKPMPLPKHVAGIVLVKLTNGQSISPSVDGITWNSSSSKLNAFIQRNKLLSAKSVFFPVVAESSVRNLYKSRAVRVPQTAVPELSQIMRWEFSRTTDVGRLVKELSAMPEVEFAEPDYYVTLAQTSAMPNDPYYVSSNSWGNSYRDQWGLERIKADGAWPIQTGRPELTVAVLDTGVDIAHPDLQARVWRNTGEISSNGLDDDGNGFIDDVNGWDFTEQDNSVTDLVGHGTHIAGIIGAVTNNGAGIAGMDWQAKIMPVRVMNDGDSSVSVFVNGLYYAVNNGADVINMSWAVPTAISQTLWQASQYAEAMGVVQVAASGNANSDVNIFAPAGFAHVITVGAWCPSNTAGLHCASMPMGDRASFSNFGAGLDVMAPGVDILSLRAANTDMECSFRGLCGVQLVPSCADTSNNPSKCPSSQYYRISGGTSMAAPFVSGLAALLLGTNPDLSSSAISDIIRGTAEDVLTSGFDFYSGAGVIDAAQALRIVRTGGSGGGGRGIDPIETQ